MRKIGQLIHRSLQNLSLLMQTLWTRVLKVMQLLSKLLKRICVWIIRALKFISIRLFFLLILLDRIMENISKIIDFIKGTN